MGLATFPERKVDRLPGRNPASPKTRKKEGLEPNPFRQVLYPSGPIVFILTVPVYSPTMSIRNRAGEWEPLLLGIEPEHCGVCGEGLYRNKTMLRGGWSRCSICESFVHYSCLASGKISYLKRRPRVCKSCDSIPPASAQDKTVSAVPSEVK